MVDFFFNFWWVPAGSRRTGRALKIRNREDPFFQPDWFGAAPWVLLGLAKGPRSSENTKYRIYTVLICMWATPVGRQSLPNRARGAQNASESRATMYYATLLEHVPFKTAIIRGYPVVIYRCCRGLELVVARANL